MEPLEHEAKLTSRAMESGHESEAGNALTYPATTVGEELEVKKLSSPSSSSSSSSSSVDSFDSDTNETSESKTKPGDITSPPEHDNEDIPVSFMPLHDQEHHNVPSHNEPISDLYNEPAATTQSPPTQFMELPVADQTTYCVYRIPSRVFTRTKSTAPNDWSVASNESLFSIREDNISFTRDQLTWLGKSGELGLPIEISIVSSPLSNAIDSGPLVELQGDEPPSNQSSMAEIGLQNTCVNESLPGEISNVSGPLSNAIDSGPLVELEGDEPPSNQPTTVEIGLQNTRVNESLPGEISNMSGPLADAKHSGPLVELQRDQPPSHQPPIAKPTEIDLQNTHTDERFGVTESNASETVGEDIKENEEELNREKAHGWESVQSASLSRRNSDASGSSVKSFAFPTLARDDKSDSLSSKGHPFPRQKSRSRSPKVVQLHHGKSHAQEPHPQNLKQAITPRATLNAVALFRWCSCLPRCHCRCQFCCC